MKSAQDIRETFSRMAMNDEETVALTVGGHTFGKMHGAVKSEHRRARARGRGPHGPGPRLGQHATRPASVSTPSPPVSRARGPRRPTKWDNTYLETIFAHEWELVESPAGAKQWQPREVKEGFWVPDAHVEGKVNPPTMIDRRHGA